MAVDPPKLVPLAIAPEFSGADADVNPDPITKCGRCRLGFVKHPSVALGDSPSWWLCPQCRTQLLGDASKTNARWSRSEVGGESKVTQRVTDPGIDEADMDVSARVARLEAALVDLAVVVTRGHLSHLVSAHISSDVMQAGRRLQVFHQAVAGDLG